MKKRLDQAMVEKGLVATRSQAESYIRLGKVNVNGKTATKAGYFVAEDTTIALNQAELYVSRAGLKLASADSIFHIAFADKVVLDVGSSTGGFTDYALQHGAKKVYAVDVGTQQLHPSLRVNPKIELHEQTNILDVGISRPEGGGSSAKVTIREPIDIVLIDVSFVSLRVILPHIATLCSPKTRVIAMLKPQFEVGAAAKNKGVIKNDAIRRKVIKEFEQWVKADFVIAAKADSEVAGTKGNQERFYVLTVNSK